jgi:hypothetical protein
MKKFKMRPETAEKTESRRIFLFLSEGVYGG